MQNNNFFELESPAMEFMEVCYSERHLIDSPMSNCKKDKDSLGNSQESLADTTCDDSSPISLKF